MSNRKYAAAVLEDGPASIEDKMESICKILSKKVNEAAQNVIREGWTPAAEHEKSFQNVVQKWFKEMNPELEDDYEIIVGTTQDFATLTWNIAVGYRKKIKPRLWVDWDYDSIGAIDATRITPGSIDATRITAGHIHNGFIQGNDTQRLDTIRVTERYGMGVMSTGGFATIGNMDLERIWNEANHDIRFIPHEQNGPFDLTVGNATYHDVEITGELENV